MRKRRERATRQRWLADHHPHLGRDEGRGLAIRLAVERLGIGRVSGKGEGGERVHNQVDPEELHGRKNRFFVGGGDGGDVGDDDGRDVDRELELSDEEEEVQKAVVGSRKQV